MPAGESLEDVRNRAVAVWDRALLEQRGGKIVICSHDAVLRVLLLTALGLTLDHFWKWSFENASLSVIQVRGDAGAETGHLVRLNDTAHLALADLRAQLGDDAAAVEEYRRLLEREPTHREGRLNLATVLRRLGRTDEARALLTVLHQERPDDAEVSSALSTMEKSVFLERKKP